MPTNNLVLLHDTGQSIWLDFIDRTILRDGSLVRRIEQDALCGMTSNPTIFEKALAEGTVYDQQIAAEAHGRTPWELFELIETDDVRTACDIFRPVYERTNGADGLVSIEVSPGAADNAAATVEEAHRLWRTVDRPNVMIKVPGTEEGALAVRRLTADGVNVNITLLFAIEAHARVIEAYLGALEERIAAGRPVDRIASVASFFVSRVDTEVDARLSALAASAPAARREELLSLRGGAAAANAKLAYALFRERFSGARWQALASHGARVQRPLWASTSTKNPEYRDVMYVEQLIAPDTVNTMTPATIEAFRDHGIVRRTADTGLDTARAQLAAIEAAGISMRSVTDKLLVDGLASFGRSFDTLLARLDEKARALVHAVPARA
jgi:transaldolase